MQSWLFSVCIKKKVCNGFIEVCNRFTLFLQIDEKPSILQHNSATVT